jgi:uncharacterized membrane protein YkgB
MNFVINMLVRIGILKDDLDYHLIRSSMVIIFLFFGYQKWFAYEAQALIPYISHGPLIFWMYPVFGVRGATYFLGASEWLFGALLFDGWAASAGGFPAMTEHVAFLMKDLLFLTASFYLLKQDVARAWLSQQSGDHEANVEMAKAA